VATKLPIAARGWIGQLAKNTAPATSEPMFHVPAVGSGKNAVGLRHV
jgi:hypothetical protein